MSFIETFQSAMPLWAGFLPAPANAVIVYTIARCSGVEGLRLGDLFAKRLLDEIAGDLKGHCCNRSSTLFMAVSNGLQEGRFGIVQVANSHYLPFAGLSEPFRVCIQSFSGSAQQRAM